MINPIQFSLKQPDGSDRNIIIEPILEQGDKSLNSTGVYKIYKDAVGEESSLFTEPMEIGGGRDDLSDNQNPDFLGKLTFTTNTDWRYEGDLLNMEELSQAIEYIKNYGV